MKLKQYFMIVIGATFFYMAGAFGIHNHIKNLLLNISTDSRVLPHYSNNWNYPVQTALHATYQPEEVKIVMLGDSHTYRVNWHELLDIESVLNRGIDGDTSAGILARLDSIERLKPKYIFLLGGYNDFRKGYLPNSVFNNFKTVLERIEAKGITPIVQSTLYEATGKYSNEITLLNRKLKDYCLMNKITFINLNKKLSKEQSLQKFYTYDDIHLNAKGYMVWKEEIQKVLKL